MVEGEGEGEPRLELAKAVASSPPSAPGVKGDFVIWL